MGFGDFLKEVGDAARFVPIVGTYVGDALGEPDEDSKVINAVENNFLKPGSQPIVKAMHGMAWLYDNGVSQPMSTWLLAGTHAETKGLGEILKASTWSKAWHVAEHVSPGQAFWADHGQVEDILKDRPMYAQPAAAYLPPGWQDMSEEEQQELLGKAGMPIIGNRAVEQMRRDSDFFKYASGATDFAARWWLDPTILGGKVIGATRAATIVKARPRGGWSGEDIAELMSSSKMAKAQKFLWENKDDPALINNLSMFRKSAIGPRAGGLIGSLKSPEEVNLFLRTSLGDVEARARLQAENAQAASRLELDTSRLADIELSALPRVLAQANPKAEKMVLARRDELNSRIMADENLHARYTAALDHYGELDAINLSRRSFAQAEARTRNQQLFRTGPALGTSGGNASKVAKSRIYADDFFGRSMTLVRSFKEANPNGLIAIDDLRPEAVDELRAHIARIPAIGSDIRGDLLNRYLRTQTEGQRMELLEEIQALGVKQVAAKHGFASEEATALYREYRANITNGQEELRRYSGAAHPGENVSVDEFMNGGGQLKVHPNMVTKLANNQVMIDLSALDKTLARHGSALKALRTSRIGNPDWLVDGADYLSHLWKFATLFRLGYIPRVLGDDLGGQIARVGAAAMAVRAGYGVKNLATNLFAWKEASRAQAAEATAREGVKFADDELKALRPEAEGLRADIATREAVHRADATRAKSRLTRAESRLNAMDPAADGVKYAAMQKLVAKHKENAGASALVLELHSGGKKSRLSDVDAQVTALEADRAAALAAAETAKLSAQRGFRQASQLHKSFEVAPGTVLPAAFQGEQGEYFMKMISSDDSLRTLLQRNKQIIHANLIKSYNHKDAAPVSYPQNEPLFVESWHKAINHQIMQDQLAKQAVKGATPDEMATWLARTVEGRAYRKRLGIKYSSSNRIASAVWHEVDEYMPATSGVREAALKGEADMDFLAEMAKNGQRPHFVHTTQLGESLAGSNSLSKGVDRVIDWWYKWAASLPADRMSRHPLFNQLYEGHARNLAGQEMKQGVKLTAADAERIATAARRLALKDTRNLVFDIAHRTDAGAMLRFMSPFYSATTEAWQRWARIIADRPQVVGYASQFFNAPISWGIMEDQEGNKVSRDGTVMVWDEKANRLVPRLVPKGERRIIARVPGFIANGPVGKAMGMDSTGTWSLSQDSMNLVTQGDPWFNPGTGPLVSIPASLLTKDKPKAAEVMRHLGVLPFGPTPGGLGKTVYEGVTPQFMKNFLTAWDTSDERYQRIKLQIMQKSAYEHANLGKPMPSAQQIADMTRNYWLFSAGTAFVQPMATQRTDRYQFYRDQYNNLRRRDPLTADEQFLSKFGESYFVFAQATSQNEGGVPATMKAAELQQKHADLITKNPDLAALIIGPEGDGPFSPEAYTYQLSTPLVPGGSEMQRTRMSADEAMRENQRRLGWTKYTAMSNQITAELHKAGFESFEDVGAERFKKTRGAIGRLYGDPLLDDGSANPYYNAEWSKDFYSMDPKKYDRMIPGLTAVAFSDLAKNPNRTDLRKLQEYLSMRKVVMGELARRDQAGGSAALKARANADLARGWGVFVDGLIESSTRFGDLFHRYLSRDMGVDVEDMTAEEAA